MAGPVPVTDRSQIKRRRQNIFDMLRGTRRPVLPSAAWILGGPAFRSAEELADQPVKHAHDLVRQLATARSTTCPPRRAGELQGGRRVLRDQIWRSFQDRGDIDAKMPEEGLSPKSEGWLRELAWSRWMSGPGKAGSLSKDLKGRVWSCPLRDAS